MALAGGIRCTTTALQAPISPRMRLAVVSTVSMSTASSSTMELDGYARTSQNQYAAHTHTRHLLQASMERLAQRCNFEDQASCMDGAPRRRRHIVDLGSADGTSSMTTLQFAISTLNQAIQSISPTNDGPIPLHITFEEHPASDEAKLRSTLDNHDEWFKQNNISRDVLMRSFYEPLFQPQSIDFLMSYICLHWLDSSSTEEISAWKRLDIDNTDTENGQLLNFTQVNETAAPDNVREHWRTNLAHRHLANFLAFRANELRPGAEAVLLMVGHPHGFMTPMDGGPNPLTRAMGRCIERRNIREAILRRTIVPYFLRTEEDVRAAFDTAADIEISPENKPDASITRAEHESKPGALLELVDCHSFETITAGSGDDVIGGAFDLFWSIHSNSIISSGATDEEMNTLKEETRRVFDELYTAKEGISSTFVALVVRKRTRVKWGA